MRLMAGDCMLFGIDSPKMLLEHPLYWMYGIVQTKTWSPVGHVEVYIGGGGAISADYRGVGIFTPNVGSSLQYVYRPRQPFRLERGLTWFQTVKGQQYDALGLLRFYNIEAADPNKKFCSDLATLFYRQCGLLMFNTVNSKTVSPGMFMTTESLEKVWQKGKGPVVY